MATVLLNQRICARWQMELKGVEAFVTVAELESMNAAARKLGYAQSTVTMQIKNLERDLKVTLLERSPTGVRLSSEGAAFLPHARAVLAAVAEAHLSVGAHTVSGALALGSMESIVTARLLPMFEFMSHRNPDLQVQLRPSLCSDAIESVIRGDLDAAFVVDDRTVLPGVQAEVLCEEPLVLVGAPGHALAEGDSISIDQIRQARIVGTEPGCAYRDRFEAILTRDGGEIAPIIELGSIDAIRQAVVSMNAVALLPKVSVAEALAAGQLAAIAWEVPFTVRTLVLYSESKRLTPKLTELIGAARKVISETA